MLARPALRLAIQSLVPGLIPAPAALASGAPQGLLDSTRDQSSSVQSQMRASLVVCQPYGFSLRVLRPPLSTCLAAAVISLENQECCYRMFLSCKLGTCSPGTVQGLDAGPGS